MNTAAGTATNAAENNFLFLIPVILIGLEVIDKALMLKDAYDFAEAVKNDDQEKIKEMALDLGISIAVEGTIGSVIPGSNIITKLVQKLKKAGVGKTAIAKVEKIFGGKVDGLVDIPSCPIGTCGAALNPNTYFKKMPDGTYNSVQVPDWKRFLLKNSKPTDVSGLVDPNKIRFTHDNIGKNFKNSSPVSDLITGLKNKTTDPNTIPPIRVFEADGMIFSLDNRRLHAFQEADIPIRVKPASLQEIKSLSYKGSTKNGGISIVVR